MNQFLHKELTYTIIGLAMEVHKKLGSGFLEKVYENSLMVLLRRENIQARQQYPIKVFFENELVGEYFADIEIDEKIIIELKTVDSLTNNHYSQLLNYLKATNYKVGLIINFSNKSLEYKRFVLDK